MRSQLSILLGLLLMTACGREDIELPGPLVDAAIVDSAIADSASDSAIADSGPFDAVAFDAFNRRRRRRLLDGPDVPRQRRHVWRELRLLLGAMRGERMSPERHLRRSGRPVQHPERLL